MLAKKSVVVAIIALVLFVGVLSFVSRNNSLKESLLLSPSEEGEITENTEEFILDTSQTNLIDAINKLETDNSLIVQNQEKLNNLLSVEASKDYEAMVRRFIEDPVNFPDAVEKPVKLNIEDYDLSITHGERITEEGDIESVDPIFELSNQNQPLEERQYLRLHFINKNGYEINIGSIFESDVYQIDNQAYAIIDSPASIESGQESEVLYSPPLPHSPPVPYNQVNRNFAVIVPYNNNFPLPANALSLINGLFPNVTQYFLDNSENTATYTFTVYPVNVPNNWDLSYSNMYNVNLVNFINAADPTINYAQYDMAMILIPYGSGGFAHLGVNYHGTFNQHITVGHYNTNEGYLIGAVPVVFAEISLLNQYPSYSTTINRVIEHEVGHLLKAFNPNINWNYFWGFLPHARGFGSINYPCPSNGPIVNCNPYEYGDELDVMGTGKLPFSHHRAVHDLGFRNPSSVQSISSSGTYTLCSTNYPAPSGCSQELLIQNPNGANLALELIATPLGPQYQESYQGQGCQNFFDSIILRAVDIEQGGGLGNIFYQPPSNGDQGDVIYPVSSAYSTCNGMMDFPLHQAQSVTTPLGTITFQSLTNVVSGKQATITFDASSAPCPNGPPQVSLTQVQGGGPLQVLQQSLFSINFQESGALQIRRSNSCVNIDDVLITTEVRASGNTYSTSRQVSLPLGIVPQDLILPSMYWVPPGIYPMNITVTPFSAPALQTTITGQLEIVNPLSWYTVVPTSYCLDLDPAPYTPQNFGTNFRSPYQHIGGVVAPNPPISGSNAFTYLPDSCIQSNGRWFASDVICSSNVPGAPLNYGVVALKSCRAEMNNQNAFCSDGVCY